MAKHLHVLVLTGLGLASSVFGASLNPGDFFYRMKISFTNYTGTETLTNFPVLVNFDTNTPSFYSDLASFSDGGDLRFTSSDQTNLLHHEVDEWNTNGTSFVWVKIPAFTNHASIWAYWSNPTASIPVYATNGEVWSNGFLGVWHMNETGNAPLDSARHPNDHSGVDAGTDGVVVDARVGKGYDYSDLGLVNISNPGDLANLTEVSVNFWYFKRGQGGGGFGSVFGGVNFNNGIRHTATDWLNLKMQGPNEVDTGSLTNGSWHHVGFTFDDSNNVAKAFLNGSEVGSNTTVQSWINPLRLVGIEVRDNRAPNGILDEMRISRVVRSSNWLHTAWLNMASNDFFNTVGSPQPTDPGLPIIKTLPATGLRTNGAAMRGELSSTGSSPTVVCLFFGTNDGGQVQSAWGFSNCMGTNVAAPPVALSSNVVGLTPDQRYYYRYRAANFSGTVWSAYSRSFVVLAPPAVDNGSGASGIGSGTATLNGRFLSENKGEAAFYWGSTDGGTSTGNWTSVTNLGQIATSSFSATLNGLTWGVPYYYRTYATNGVGEAWATSSVFFRPAKPPGVGWGSPSSTMVTPTSALVQATLSAPNSVFYTTLYYGLNDAGTNRFAWSNAVFLGAFTNIPSTNLVHSLTGLQSNQTYYYAFLATNTFTQTWTRPSDTFNTPGQGTEFAARLKITACGYTRNEVLTNFPLLVELSTNIPGFAYDRLLSPSGGDLRFMDSNLTQTLNYEIEAWNTNGTSLVWVQVPLLQDSNTCFYALWGNPGEPNPPPYALDGSTWSNGYLGVWHLAETNGVHADSSPFNNDSASVNGQVNQDAVGYIDGGDAFDGVNDWVQIPDSASLDTGLQALTLEAWVYDAQTFERPRGIISKRSGAGNQEAYYFFVWTGGVIEFNVGNDRDRGTTPLPRNEWHHVAVTFDGNQPTDRKRFYMDGLLDAVAQSGSTSIPNTTAPLHLGILNANYGDGWAGGLDELRISSVARSSNWLWAAHLNMASNAAFLCYSPVFSDDVVDLGLTKSASSTNLLYGTNVIYTLDVMNLGTTFVANVVVTDSLPIGVKFILAIPPATETNGSDYAFHLGSLSGGASTSIMIQVAVTSGPPGVLTNFAVVVSTNFELIVANNADTALTRLPDSDGDGWSNPADPDDDNDGVTDVDEAIANTDALDADSFLWVRILRTGTQTVQSLTFPTSTGRTYRIEGTTNLLTGPWVEVQTNLPGTGAFFMIPRTNGIPHLYYRIGVESP